MSLQNGIPTRQAIEALFKDSKLKLTDDQFCELLEVMAIYATKFQEPPISTDEPIHFATEWVGFRNPLRAETMARQAVVEHVQEIWREAGATTPGYKYDSQAEIHSGDLINLLFELFKLTTSGSNFPQQATLFHDLQFINYGIEREH
ncbi:MAG: hypothetical protein EKK40_05510 [Bradyrhizobiaceae bacterium]|nr:MAG: hypothetical protein EKK40_05510 [Bradyrhizobiaceae bacterium]